MGRIRVQLPAALAIALLLIGPRIATANTESQQHYAKGLIPFQAGQWESAYASFSNAVKADPTDAIALYYRGISGAQLGFTENAIADVEQALQLRPDLHEAVLDLGVLYLDAGQYERAESWLERAYQIPEDRFRAALFLGIASYRRGDDPTAQAHLQNAAKDPRIRPVANYYEGLSLLRQGNPDAAEPLFSETQQALPGTPVAMAIDEFDIRSAPRAPSRAASDQNPWSVYGKLGFAYDSNVKLAPDDSDDIKRERAAIADAMGESYDYDVNGEQVGRMEVSFGGRYRVLDTSMFVGSLGYDGYQGVNFGETAYDISSHRFRGDFSTRPDRWYQVGVATWYDYYGRNYKSFFHEGVLTPWVGFFEGDAAATQVYYRLRGRDYTRGPFEPWRDAINNAIGVKQLLLLGAVDRVLSIGYQWSDNDPLSRDGTDFAYQAHQLDFELDAPVFDWFDTSLGYTLIISDYEHPNSRTAFVYGRNDTEHQFVIHAERRFARYFTASLDYFGIVNGSNLDEFEYGRNIVSAGVSMQF